ncbi:MAG TPA: hypothetical protein VE955_12545, partial [Candidatus Dormibacteraeota bacterium]|nr:hypothetical protein [Candidatus Dormibacteraeota bacterium]
CFEFVFSSCSSFVAVSGCLIADFFVASLYHVAVAYHYLWIGVENRLWFYAVWSVALESLSGPLGVLSSFHVEPQT